MGGSESGSSDDMFNSGDEDLIFSIEAYCLAVTAACLVLCIICIIQTIVQVCLCRKLRKERSIIFKHNSGKGEVNPMHWITDLENDVDRALDQPAISVSTPNLNVWYSPEMERNPQTFFSPREERRYSDAKKPKTFMTPPKEERRYSDARKPKTFMNPPKEERRNSDARKPKAFMSPPKEERRNSDAKKPKAFMTPPKEERETSEQNNPGDMASPESTAPLSIPQATVKKSLSHGDLRSASVKPKRVAPSPPNIKSDLSVSHGDLRESFSRPRRVAPSPPSKKSDTLPLLIKTEKRSRKENDYTEMEDDDYENVANLQVAASIPSDPARESPTAGIYAGLNRHLRDRPADYAVPTRK